MTLNPVDTFTDHGNYKGDPAKVAFVKLNENDAYLEQLAKAALPKVGGILSGPLTTESTITATGRALIAEGSVGAVPTAGKYLLQSVTSDGAFITSYNYSLPNVAPLTIEASYINTAARVATSALAVPHNSAGTEILWNGLAAENGYGCSEYLNFRGAERVGIFYACVANVSQRRTARIREGGSIDCYPVQPNPGGSVGTFGFHTQEALGWLRHDDGEAGRMVDGKWRSELGVTQTGTSMGTRMRLSEDGVLSATAFNPTSSADVRTTLKAMRATPTLIWIEWWSSPTAIGPSSARVTRHLSAYSQRTCTMCVQKPRVAAAMASSTCRRSVRKMARSWSTVMGIPSLTRTMTLFQ